MKYIKSMIIASIIAIMFNACSSDSKTSPITIEMEQAYNEAWNYFYPRIIVTSLKNKVAIEDIKINKGNCKFTIFHSKMIQTVTLPEELDEYQELDVRVASGCRVKVVDIVVNNNSWSFTFE